MSSTLDAMDIPRPLLEEWQELCDQATPGPWTSCQTPPMSEGERDAYLRDHMSLGGDVVYGVGAPRHPDTILGDDLGRPIHMVMPAITGNGVASAANREFIAMAREAVPRLIAEVWRLRAFLDLVLNRALEVKGDELL